MHLIAKVIRISRAKFHCNRLTTVQDIQDYASLIISGHTVVVFLSQRHTTLTLLIHKNDHAFCDMVVPTLYAIAEPLTQSITHTTQQNVVDTAMQNISSFLANKDNMGNS